MKQGFRAVACVAVLGLLSSACSDAPRNPVSPSAPNSRPLTVRLAPQQRAELGTPAATRPSYTLEETSAGTAVTLTFEGIGSEVPIGDFYRDQGVIFTWGDALAVGGGLNDYYFPPRSGAAIAYSPMGGPVALQFTRRATEVGGYVTSYYGMTLTCYNAQGHGVGSATAPGPNLANYDQSVAPPHTFIRVRASGIVRCSFSSAANLHAIDDVTFTLENPRLQCTPSVVERGQRVRCAMPVDQAYRVVSQRSRGQGFTIVEEPGTAYPGGTEYFWEGIAVADSRVQVVLETTDAGTTKQTTHSASFQVRNRDWPKLQLKAPRVHIGIRGTMQAYPSNGVLGNAAPDLPLSTANVLPVTRPTSGPNVGLSFLTDPLPPIDHVIYLHPGLYNLPSTPPTLSQIWHLDQNGRGSGTCTGTIFGSPLIPFAERHEGVTQAPNSHWGITSRFYQNTDAEQRLERMYVYGVEDYLRADVFTEFVNLHNTGTHAQQQSAFDRAEYQTLYDSLGCTLDNNPNNA